MKERKHSIFDDMGHLRFPKEGSRRTICDVHLRLAKDIQDSPSIPLEERAHLLNLVDELYDMGKRMGNKLKEYHDTYVGTGGWREDF